MLTLGIYLYSIAFYFNFVRQDLSVTQNMLFLIDSLASDPPSSISLCPLLSFFFYSKSWSDRPVSPCQPFTWRLACKLRSSYLCDKHFIHRTISKPSSPPAFFLKFYCPVAVDRQESSSYGDLQLNII